MTNKAIIAKVTEVIAIPGADRIQAAKVLGEQVIVSNDVKVGDIGVLFPTGVVLSQEYASENNLFRESSWNKDSTKKGFFDQPPKVRAQTFLKVKSEGYFATVASLAFTGADLTGLKVGDSFDSLGGVEICKKWVNITKQAKAGKPKARKQSTTPFFEKHVDSEQFRHFASTIPVGAILSFHAKVHGTSQRITNTVVEKPITGWWNKLKARLQGNTDMIERRWEVVVGTRNVVLDAPDKDGYHGKEAFRFEVADMLKPYLEKGMTVYGEIAGYANQRPIMPQHNVKALKDSAFTKKYGEQIVYKYGCKEHEYRFHVYRITRLTYDGKNVDMSQKEMEAWCKDRGILTTFEVHPQIVYNGNLEQLQKLVEELTERPDVLTEDYIDQSHISEGVIIRVDYNGYKPKFFKNKSYAFRVMEGLETVENLEDVS